MSATVQSPRPSTSNRRRSVRQKIHAPAYASFAGASTNEMLDLYEVLDISEDGVAIQCPSPMEINRQVELCLDLSESSDQVSAIARVVWSDSSGRVGLGFPALPDPALRRLRRWLFLNAMAGAANAASSSSSMMGRSGLRPNYSDTLNAASAVQREAESLGTDIAAVLSLIALRSHSLLRASGAAIALAGDDAKSMVCRASAGQSAPPVGATLQVGSGLSGECVRTGRTLRCDDTETDERVDRESCRALGIRSILAVPVLSRAKVIGLLEVFSAQPNAFDENDGATLQRFAETISGAVNRARGVDQSSAPVESIPKPFASTPGSILFASAEEPEEKVNVPGDKVGGVHLPRAHLYLLYCVAATIALVLGFMLAPWIQEKLQARGRNGEQTVLASTHSPQPTVVLPPSPAVETATLSQLQQLAEQDDPAAENALGLRYASGDGVKQDDVEAAHWFTKAAEHGNVKAEVALATRYWAGRGVVPSLSQAYFWSVLARAAGDKNSKTFAEFLASRMTRAQATAIEQQAEIWYQQHESRAKPNPGR